MSILQWLPWASLTLLSLTYSILGWMISAANISELAWLLVIVAVLLLMENLTLSGCRIADYYGVYGRFSFKSVSLVFLGAFLVFILIAWVRIFINVLVMIGAAIVARLDLQAVGFGKRQSFWILSVFSLVGLALGEVVGKKLFNQ